MENTLLVAEEVAELLRVDKQRVYELARRRQIPVIKVGERQYRFSSHAINRWLENGGSVQIDNSEAAGFEERDMN